MGNLLDIVSKRQLPGVILLDESGNLQFMNETVSDIVPIVFGEENPEAQTLPEALRNVVFQLKESGLDSSSVSTNIFFSPAGNPYFLRAFPLGIGADGNQCPMIMVLIETIAERRQVDFEEIRKKYKISKREVEVLKLMCQGYSNREISNRLCISEHTAKDHVKKILQIFGATSRTGVIAALNH